MNELTIGPADEASLHGDSDGGHGGGGLLAGTLRERCRKLWRRVSLASGASWGTCGVVDYCWRALDREHLSLWELC